MKRQRQKILWFDFNKTKLQEQSGDYYKNLPEKEKKKTREYARNGYKNMAYEEKKKRK